jgi:hypothetical protein
MTDITKEDIGVLMETVQKYWPFDKKHYPKMNEDGTVTVTLRLVDFIMLHMLLHQADYLGRIAILLERNQHEPDWNATEEDLRTARKNAMSQAISALRLFAATGGSSEELQQYLTKVTKKKKTKETSEYE